MNFLEAEAPVEENTHVFIMTKLVASARVSSILDVAEISTTSSLYPTVTTDVSVRDSWLWEHVHKDSQDTFITRPQVFVRFSHIVGVEAM